ncbi:MAG: hypothetical protein MPJ50_06380 [Pirellulales bacterium]|nr:hypothetical protein [Pirellulales bacterium]
MMAGLPAARVGCARFSLSSSGTLHIRHIPACWQSQPAMNNLNNRLSGLISKLLWFHAQNYDFHLACALPLAVAGNAFL